MFEKGAAFIVDGFLNEIFEIKQISSMAWRMSVLYLESV